MELERPVSRGGSHERPVTRWRREDRPVSRSGVIEDRLSDDRPISRRGIKQDSIMYQVFFIFHLFCLRGNIVI